MITHADKTQENKSQSVASAVTQRQSSSASIFQFVDNRPEAIAQRKLQEMVNNHPKAKQATQLQAMANSYSSRQQKTIQKKENNTGLPDNLKSGIENLSGYSMDDVKVHYHSDKPAQLQAHAYAQGSDIHLGSGQEKHLPHEAWHVVQQKQGRVTPTVQLRSKVNINDDAGLEKEADVMGEKALQRVENSKKSLSETSNISSTLQLTIDLGAFETKLKQDYPRWKPGGPDSMSKLFDAIDEYNVGENEEKFDEVMALKRGLKSKYYKRFGSALDWLDYRLKSEALFLNHPEEGQSALTQSALDSRQQGKATDNFKQLLTIEIKAKNGPKSAGMDSFSGQVIKVFDAMLGNTNKNPKTVLHRAIWHYIGDYMEDEPGFEKATGYASSMPKYAMGMQSHAVMVGGFLLHFTGRTRPSDVQKIMQIVDKLDTTVKSIHPDKLVETILINFKKDSLQTINTIETTTKDTSHTASKGDIAKGASKAKVTAIRQYAAAVIDRWKQAALTGKIHIVFDRAHLDDAYGKSSANTDATPANMMKGDKASIDKGQRVTINLDSENLNRIYITLAHELAHAIGFNPTGMDPHGHFSHLDHYLEDESGFGSKLMFDAYYFETLIQHFYK